MSDQLSDHTEQPRAGNDKDPTARAEPEYVAWAEEHDQEKRLHEASLAQITEHHDIDGEQTAIHEQEAWARRRDKEHHLHDSAMEQLRHHND
ncbi:hypothetical protein [Synechococcus sp. GFB01]|uniref:hypothetical protein n=1 Tax=Synechococcus sp. GFB01 TaxID=1662190 RepID=UPI000907F95E|nr:hypothetical protein [Synechococcus sp. GFB01]